MIRFSSKVLGDSRTELERLNINALMTAFREAEHIHKLRNPKNKGLEE